MASQAPQVSCPEETFASRNAVHSGPDCSAAAEGQDKARTSQYIDTKIKNICLVLSIMVVLNHSRTVDMTYGWDGVNLSPVSLEYLRNAPVEIFLEHFLSGALGRITNPFFFLTSGFLFFYGWQPTLVSWKQKLRKRVFTLLIPYCLWTFLGMAVNFLTLMFATPGATHSQQAAAVGDGGDLTRLFLSMPAPGQLWFVRAIMLIMLGAPLLAYVVTSLREKALFVILALYLSPFQTPWDWVDKSAICFFGFGATLGYLKSDLEIESGRFSKLLVVFSLAMAAVYTIFSLITEWDLTLLFKFMIMGGLLGVWAGYDLLPNRVHGWLSALSPYRFFIYMAFDPLLTILQNKFAEIVVATETTNVLQYLLLPTTVVLVCVGLAYLLRRCTTRFYFFLTGGR